MLHRRPSTTDETPILSNEEFDNLKDELLWAGSKVAVLRWAHPRAASLGTMRPGVSPPHAALLRAAWLGMGSTTEQKFLEASLAYQAGKSIVSDEEFDRLKAELRKKNSKVVQQVRPGGRRRWLQLVGCSTPHHHQAKPDWLPWLSFC